MLTPRRGNRVKVEFTFTIFIYFTYTLAIDELQESDFFVQ